MASLHDAARDGHVELVQQLLNSGAPVAAAAGFTRRTALHMAAEGGHTDVVQLLLDTDESVAAATDYDGLTALDMAALRGYARLCTRCCPSVHQR